MQIKTKIHLSTGDSFTTMLDGDLHLTKNLQVYEVANNQASEELKLEIFPKSWLLFEMFQFIRDHYGKAITVTSGYRTKTFNALPRVGGSSNSLHLKCLALDIVIPYNQQVDIVNWIYLFTVQHNLIGGCNRYPDRMHIDVAEDLFGYKDYVIRDKTLDKTILRTYR